MKKITILLVALVAGVMTFQSCEDLDDNAVPVNDFIWKGLNSYYLWQEKVPNLADDRFANQKALYDFTRSYDSPESLFESLLYGVNENGQRVDRFSVIFPDYRVLENALQGVSKSNGMEYGLAYTDESRTTVVGYVRYYI